VPWYWISLSSLLFLLGLIGTHPISIDKTQDPSIMSMFWIKVRQYSFAAIAFLIIVMPATVWAAGVSVYSSNKEQYTSAFVDFMLSGFMSVWEFPIIGMLFGMIISFTYNRYLLIKVSAFKRRFAVKQSGDSLSDIRAEQGQVATRNFKPEKYYKKDYIFFGLDQDNKPIYEPAKVWNTRHIRAVGPTQTGKGVEIGLQLDQSIRKGDTTIFIDPKPDKHAKAIMKRAAKESGRAFIECDLNEEGRGKYAPFLGGTKRDRRARLLYALGLQDSGTDADFFKAAEREVIDSLFSSWDGQLKSLKQMLIKDRNLTDATKRTQSYLNEWLSISTFSPDSRKNKTGLSIERCLMENAVVYIRGNLDDEVINSACSVLMMEIVQECKRLSSDKKGHTFLAVDEVAFLVNERFADALATVASFGCNILLAYQSEGDLLNLKDKSQNAEAISSRIKTNCKYSLYYMAQDFETAQVMADDSGLIQKAVTRSEKVTMGRHMSETWGQERDIHRVEENLITTNRARMLPERVGILYRPSTNATMCYTSWIDVDLDKWGDQFVADKPADTLANNPPSKPPTRKAKAKPVHTKKATEKVPKPKPVPELEPVPVPVAAPILHAVEQKPQPENKIDFAEQKQKRRPKPEVEEKHEPENKIDFAEQKQKRHPKPKAEEEPKTKTIHEINDF